MMAEFYVSKCWETKKGLIALRDRKVSVNNNLDRSIACLTYPTIQFIFEAWLKSGDEPCAVEENDEFGGDINFSIFVVLKGNTPADRPNLADDEDGLMWESHEFIDEDVNDIDFSLDDWKQILKKRMIDISERYVKENNFTFDKSNF